MISHYIAVSLSALLKQCLKTCRNAPAAYLLETAINFLLLSSLPSTLSLFRGKEDAFLQGFASESPLVIWFISK